MDDADRRILRALQNNPDLTMRELGEETGLSHTPCWRRLSKMKELGIVEERRFIINPAAVGFDIVFFCQVRMKEHSREGLNAFEAAIEHVPAVNQCYTMTGSYDYILRVLAKSVEAFEMTVKNSLMELPNVAVIHTSLTLKEVKNSSKVPL